MRLAAEMEVITAPELTDLGNAERLVDRHGADLRYCHPFRVWYVWDGRRWREDDTGEIARRAKDAVRAILTEAAIEPDTERQGKLAKHAVRSQGAARIAAAIELASTEPGIPVTPAELDVDPFALNCANGTLDLRTGELRSHRREDLITKLAPVDYDPQADLEPWTSFLAQATGGDEALLDFLQRAVGYTLTGDTGEEKLFFPHGPAATGKSTFLEAVGTALGDYAKRADFDSFLQRRDSGGPRADIARLAGARLVVSVEVDDGKKLAEGLVKQLTGGDTITARQLYREAFEFKPAFKLWLAANHAPQVRSDDGAMWRRILRLPFEQVIPVEARDPAVKASLRDPKVGGPAVLRWAVEGCLAWQRRGLDVPAGVLAATEEYREDQDPLRAFLADRCVMVAQAWTPTADLRAAYQAHCEAEGETPLGAKRFGAQLRARGCEQDSRKVAGRTKRGWSGIGLVVP